MSESQEERDLRLGLKGADAPETSPADAPDTSAGQSSDLVRQRAQSRKKLALMVTVTFIILAVSVFVFGAKKKGAQSGTKGSTATITGAKPTNQAHPAADSATKEPKAKEQDAPPPIPEMVPTELSEQQRKIREHGAPRVAIGKDMPSEWSLADDLTIKRNPRSANDAGPVEYRSATNAATMPAAFQTIQHGKEKGNGEVAQLNIYDLIGDIGNRPVKQYASPDKAEGASDPTATGTTQSSPVLEYKNPYADAVSKFQPAQATGAHSPSTPSTPQNIAAGLPVNPFNADGSMKSQEQLMKELGDAHKKGVDAKKVASSLATIEQQGFDPVRSSAALAAGEQAYKSPSFLPAETRIKCMVATPLNLAATSGRLIGFITEDVKFNGKTVLKKGHYVYGTGVSTQPTAPGIGGGQNGIATFSKTWKLIYSYGPFKGKELMLEAEARHRDASSSDLTVGYHDMEPGVYGTALTDEYKMLGTIVGLNVLKGISEDAKSKTNSIFGQQTNQSLGNGTLSGTQQAIDEIIAREVQSADAFRVPLRINRGTEFYLVLDKAALVDAVGVDLIQNPETNRVLSEKNAGRIQFQLTP